MVVTGLPGSPMAKNLSAHAGQATPGLERPNMLQSNQACVPQLLSSHSLEPMSQPRTYSPQQGKSTQ